MVCRGLPLRQLEDGKVANKYADFAFMGGSYLNE
jgi:hypothetical protein